LHDAPASTKLVEEVTRQSIAAHAPVHSTRQLDSCNYIMVAQVVSLNKDEEEEAVVARQSVVSWTTLCTACAELEQAVTVCVLPGENSSRMHS
jgi:hypothetical protein